MTISSISTWRDLARKSNIVQFEITDYDFMMAPTSADYEIVDAFEDCWKTLRFLLGEDEELSERSGSVFVDW